MTPYDGLAQRAFWKNTADRGRNDVPDLWWPKFQISRDDFIATAGSCFAQNIGKALQIRGMKWLEMELPPPGMPKQMWAGNGYGLFSCRTGNILTIPALLQWLSWATDSLEHPTEVWEQEGRFYDPFRPSVAPNGFASAEDVLASRATTIGALQAAVRQTNVFFFTPGQTEAWSNRHTGLIYPACPGTVRGRFDPVDHQYQNFGFTEGRDALLKSIALMRQLNPDIRLLLTVSPVPITATQEPRHVLAANAYSKSTLRSIVGEVSNEDPLIDYFPSYELCTTPMLENNAFGPNKRTISAAGVDYVMQHFFTSLGLAVHGGMGLDGDTICEDEKLRYYDKT